MEKLTSINLKSIVSKINELIELTLDNSRKLDNSEIVKRIKALEDKPEPKPNQKQKEFDDSEIMLAISEIRESLASLDKRVDFIRRTYSEKWQQSEFDRTKFQKTINEQIYKIETPQDVDLSDIERRIDKLESIDHVDLSDVENRISKLESVEHTEYDDREIKASISEVRKSIPQPYNDSAIRKSISDIKKAIPQPINLSGVESRLKKLEEKPNYFYNDKPIVKEIDSVKTELSKIKKSVNDILE